jgi:hypothetical protein
MSDTVTIPREEYKALKNEANADKNLLMSLIKGLEDIKSGKVKPWKKSN